jgi:hypothetical protein
MYRTKALVDEEKSDAPRTLLYRPDPRYNDRSQAHFAIPFGVAFGVMGILAVLGLSNWVIPGALLSGGGLYLVQRRGRMAPRATFHFDGDRLHVTLRKARAPFVVSLKDLRDVRLEIKTIERVQEASGGNSALRFINANVMPKMDTARIALEASDGSVVLLTDEYLSHMDSSDWVLQIRRFLRKHGWVPLSERKAAAPRRDKARLPRSSA